MKILKKITLVFMLLIVAKGMSQNKTTIEKSIFGIDVGYLGFWINNEARLTHNLSLKSELGIGLGEFGGSQAEKFRNIGSVVLLPSVALEPRYYYNVRKRAVDNKLVNNGGPFIALNLKYQSDLFTISRISSIHSISNISVTPRYCFRENLGGHFHYEAGLGFSYAYILKKTDLDADIKNRNIFDLDAHLRIGYNF